MKQSGIYCIKNKVNGKLYVGSATDINVRFSTHRHALRKGTHANIALQAAWVKYSEEAFSFEVLEIIKAETSLIEREQYFIDLLSTVAPGGYNIRPIASSNYGLHHTQEAKAKIANAMTGKKNPGSSAAHKGKKLPAAHVEKVAASNRGKKRSAETKAKLSECAKGNKRWLGKHHTEETKAKIAARKTGSKWTEEQRIKCVAARYNISDETRRRMAEAARGRKDSLETKAKKSAALMGRVLSAESRAKIGAANKIRAAERKDELRKAA
jgi:predicted GIY-YIG superfamily endonuclease